MKSAWLVAGLFLLGSGSANAADPLIIDNWWNLDFACPDHDASCEREVLYYVDEFTTQMAGSPQCAGVSVIAGWGPKKFTR